MRCRGHFAPQPGTLAPSHCLRDALHCLPFLAVWGLAKKKRAKFVKADRFLFTKFASPDSSMEGRPNHSLLLFFSAMLFLIHHGERSAQELASGLSLSSIGGGTHLSFWAYVRNLLDNSGPDLIQSKHEVHLEFWVGLYPLKRTKMGLSIYWGYEPFYFECSERRPLGLLVVICMFDYFPKKNCMFDYYQKEEKRSILYLSGLDIRVPLKKVLDIRVI